MHGENLKLISYMIRTSQVHFRETAVYAVWFVFHVSVCPPDCSHRCNENTPYCMYSCLSEDEPKRFETCKRHKRL